jgi:hypothetical protein
LSNHAGMNDREREQLGLIVAHELSAVERSISEKIKAVFAEHTAQGRLHSGATVKVSVRTMQQIADRFLCDLGQKFRVVADDQEAFAILAKAVGDCLDICETQMLPVTRMASGRMQGALDESIERAGADMFNQMRADIEAKLAIAAFDFAAPPKPDAVQPMTIPIQQSAKKGGRPPAEFWDDVWAEIAVALYNGDLAPKSQADVERAMIERIEALGFSAAESTVRARARRLWDRLSTPD